MVRRGSGRFAFSIMIRLVAIAWAASSLFGCSESVQPSNLNFTPEAPDILGSRTESRGIRIAWNHVYGVDPDLFTSGYKIYIWSNESPFFEPTTSLVIRNGLDAPWPRIARANSLADTHMETVVWPLKAGTMYRLYVTALQNGHESATSDTIVDFPYVRYEGIKVREASLEAFSFYLIGDSEETQNHPVITDDRLGYKYDEDERKQYLPFRSLEDGGSLRILTGREIDEFFDPPVDLDGALVGYVTDPAADRIEIERGSVLFVWNTKGTSRMFDDHFARIIVRTILDGKYMKIDCDYQPRENLPNL